MRGLALEGGGARGAYHIGVVKAYIENGYEFDGYVGTSIGAVNAAILAQGEFERALDLWMNISMEQIFDEDELHFLRLTNFAELKIDRDLPANTKKALSKIIGGRGVDTSKIRSFFEKYLDEDKIRRSGKDFGLVTVSVNERKAHELMLEDIPQGSLVDYIIASSSLPGFRPTTIDEKWFLDGGLYNNLPVNLLLAKGYDEIIAVRTRAPGLVHKIDENTTVISPREDLGSIILFSPEHSAANIKYGYYDALRVIKNLRGSSYFIEPVCPDDFNSLLITLDDDIIYEAGKILNSPRIPAKRMLFENIIPQLSSYLKLEKDYDYADFVIALIENAARQREIEQYQVYSYDQLISLIKDTEPPEREKTLFDKIPMLIDKRKTAAEFLTRYLLR